MAFGCTITPAAQNVQDRRYQVSVKGGEPIPLSDTFKGMFPVDISRDHSEFLLAQQLDEAPNGPYPIWSAGILSGQLRRVGNIAGMFAGWSPDGQSIAYTKGQEVHLARSDGEELRTLARVKGLAGYVGWSPDGRRIRFGEGDGTLSLLWEVFADGSGPLRCCRQVKIRTYAELRQRVIQEPGAAGT